MDVRLPDGTVIQNVPDGISKAELTAKLKANGYDVSKLEAPTSAAPEPFSFTGMLGKVGMGALEGAKFGPFGIITGAALEAGKEGTKALENVAYKAGGAVTDVASSLGAPVPVAAGAGFATNIGIQALPMLAGGEVAKGFSPQFVHGARNLMQSALKPTLKNLQTGKADRAITTLLNEGINVTPGGVEKLYSSIDNLNSQVTQALVNSGATVDKNLVASRIQDVVNRIEATNPTPQDAINAVERVYNQFMANGLVPQRIPVTQAQALKQGIYRVIKDKYGQLSSDTVEAQKALARGFKEEIASAVPGVAPLNARESELLNALSVTERRVLMAANKNPMGLSLLAKNPAAWASFMADRSELFKSLMARMLHSGAEQIPATAARVAITAPDLIKRNDTK